MEVSQVDDTLRGDDSKTKKKLVKALQAKMAIEIQNEQLQRQIERLTLEAEKGTEDREEELTQEISVMSMIERFFFIYFSFLLQNLKFACVF